MILQIKGICKHKHIQTHQPFQNSTAIQNNIKVSTDSDLSSLRCFIWPALISTALAVLLLLIFSDIGHGA